MKSQNKPAKKIQLQKVKIASLSTRQMTRIYGGVAIGTNTLTTVMMYGGPQGPPIKNYTNTLRGCASGIDACGSNTCNC